MSASTMTPQDLSDDEEDQRVESTKRIVGALQDMILQMIDTFATEYPDCDPAAYPLAICQAFVAQCLKTYNIQGFDAASKQAKLIIDEMEKTFCDSAGGYTM